MTFQAWRGLLLVDKPRGWTSHDVVAWARGLLGIRKVGHTGTLDPEATGVLPLCLGEATKLARYLQASGKHYRVVMRLGVATDTQDATGKPVGGAGPVQIPEEEIQKTLEGFVGRIRQVPPMYSAVKVGGVPLYRLARRGQEVERAPRWVEIYAVRLRKVEGDRVTFEVECSKGTYIRTLCADVGEVLGVGAHLLELRRLRTGPFRLEDAATVEELERWHQEGRLPDRILPLEKIVEHLPGIWIPEEWVPRVRNGVPVERAAIQRLEGDFQTGDPLRILDPQGHLVAMGSALCPRGKFQARRKGQKIVKVDRVLL